MREPSDALMPWRPNERSMHARFAAFSELFGLGAMLLDGATRIELASATARMLLGAADDAMLARIWDEAIATHVRERLLAMPAGESSLRAQIHVLHEPQALAVRLQAYRIDEADGAGFLVLLKARHAGDPIEADLLDASRMRNLVKRFDSATHEIRAPLNALSLNCHLLQAALAPGQEDVPEARGHAAVVHAELQRLNSMLNDLIETVQPGALEPAQFDLVMLAEQVCREVQPLAHAAGVHIRSRAAGEPVWVAGHAGSLRQALLNIMHEALAGMAALAAAGTLSISVTREAEHARVVIADTGYGLSTERLEDALRLYYAPHAGAAGGALYLARLVCESHGGDFEVQSVAGRGSVFTLTLPLA